MPTLIRLVVNLAAIVGLVYLGMWALVTFVEPEQRTITERIRIELPPRN